MPYLVRSMVTYPGALPASASQYAITDLNGDGFLDIIMMFTKVPLEDAALPFTIVLGDGLGSFTSAAGNLFPSGVPSAVTSRQVLIADFNGDGRPDVFVANHGYDTSPFPGEQNMLLLSSGAHGLINATDRLPQVSDFTHSAAIGDVDGDGDVDVLVMNVSGGTPPSGSPTAPYFLINDGTAQFTRHDDFLPTDVAARDFGGKYTFCLFFDADRDGDLDLFLGTHGETATNYSRMLYNSGAGNFASAVTTNLPPPQPWGNAGSTAIDAKSVDLNGDGRFDLIIDFAIDNYEGHFLQFLINDGAGGWIDESQSRLPQSINTDERYIGNIDVVDFNGDGFVDIIGRNGARPPIYINDGSGHFTNLPASFLDTSGYFGVDWTVNYLTLDANGDGRMDIVADVGANTQSGQNTIFLFTQQDPGSSQTGTVTADALLGDASDETLLGMGGDDVIFGAAGNDVLSGGAGADKMVGGVGADLFADTAANLNGDTIADFTRSDRIVITDATAGSTLSWNGGVLTYGPTSLTLTNLQNASITTGASPGGGVQIASGGPALIVAAGPSVSSATGAAASERSKMLAASPHFPLWKPDIATLLGHPDQIRFADDIFALA